MNVGIMYSGGKDSTFAVDWAKTNGHDVRWLLSVKPTRNDCYLYHYATVEHTPILAGILGIPHKLITCDVAEPTAEANLARDVIKTMEKVDAVILGGTGLQETQIGSLKMALAQLGIKVFASHQGKDHGDVMREMLAKGYRFVITQIAADGLNKDDLGRELTADYLETFFKRSERYGFHNGGDGGVYDTLTIDGPMFDKAIDVTITDKVMESVCAGHAVCSVKVAQKIAVKR